MVAMGLWKAGSPCSHPQHLHEAFTRILLPCCLSVTVWPPPSVVSGCGGRDQGVTHGGEEDVVFPGYAIHTEDNSSHGRGNARQGEQTGHPALGERSSRLSDSLCGCQSCGGPSLQPPPLPQLPGPGKPPHPSRKDLGYWYPKGRRQKMEQNTRDPGGGREQGGDRGRPTHRKGAPALLMDNGPSSCCDRLGGEDPAEASQLLP